MMKTYQQHRAGDKDFFRAVVTSEISRLIIKKNAIIFLRNKHLYVKTENVEKILIRNRICSLNSNWFSTIQYADCIFFQVNNYENRITASTFICADSTKKI